jgi:beta-galactosidase
VLPAVAAPETPVVAGTVDARDHDGKVTLTAAGTVLTIDRGTGLIDYRKDGQVVLIGGAPNFYRAVTDNDIGTGTERTHDIWKTASAERKVEAVTVERSGGDVGVRVRFAIGGASARFESRFVQSDIH